jgi:hypothetical protein
LFESKYLIKKSAIDNLQTYLRYHRDQSLISKL